MSDGRDIPRKEYKRSPMTPEEYEASRFELGDDNIELYVKEVPESCMDCTYFPKNINQDKLMNDDLTYYCILRSQKVSAQYGGIDVTNPIKYKCPLKPITESEAYINHEERITYIEEILGI